jgi:2-methylcitrate dehydratase PrpD
VTEQGNLTRWIARHALSLDYARLPMDVATIAKQCFLDWLCVTLAGWADPLVAALIAEVDEDGGRPVATLLGEGRKASASQAALVNGAASHALDFDDVHLRSRVHPSVPLFPAILATAERRGMGGRDVILAFVAGVETQSRIAAYMGEGHYRKGWHNTGTLGTFGAALAVGRMLSLTEEEGCHALGIAATQAAGLRAVFGTMCKPLHAGKAAMNGLLAAQLAARGFQSRTNILEADEGFARTQGDGLFPDAAVAEPDRFHARSVIFKYHASCYGTHAPIEAALRARQHLRDWRMLANVEVLVEPQYLSVCNIIEPKTGTEAKFSLTHTVAMTLADRDTAALESFSERAVADPELAELRRRITVRGAPDLARAHAEIRLRFHNGVEHSEHVDASVPESDLDRQWKRLEDKFCTLTRSLIGRREAETILSASRHLETLDRVADMATACRIVQQTSADMRSGGAAA